MSREAMDEGRTGPGWGRGLLAGALGVALAAGCIRSKSKLDWPRNPKMAHDIYDTLFPTRLEASEFRRRMMRKESILQGIIQKVYTAPEWNVELARRREERAASGLPPEEFRINRGARFNVEVPQDPKLTRTYLVAPDGYIDVPHLGRVYVEGLTISQFKALMAERLSEIIRRPEVHVNFEGFLDPFGGVRLPEVGYLYVFGGAAGLLGNPAVGGAGLRAGKIPFTGRETLMSVLIDSGGLPENTYFDQTVVYRKVADRKVIAIVSNPELYVKRFDFDQDFPMEPYDVLYMPLEYSYTDDKIKGLIGYFLGWLTTGTSMDDAVQDIERRNKERWSR